MKTSKLFVALFVFCGFFQNTEAIESTTYRGLLRSLFGKSPDAEFRLKPTQQERKKRNNAFKHQLGKWFCNALLEDYLETRKKRTGQDFYRHTPYDDFNKDAFYDNFDEHALNTIIWGLPQSTCRGHATQIVAKTLELYKDENVKAIYLDIPLSNIIIDGPGDKRRPDITVLLNDGRHGIYEVVSESQTYESQRDKIESIIKENGEDRFNRNYCGVLQPAAISQSPQRSKYGTTGNSKIQPSITCWGSWRTAVKNLFAQISKNEQQICYKLSDYQTNQSDEWSTAEFDDISIDEIESNGIPIPFPINKGAITRTMTSQKCHKSSENVDSNQWYN